MKKRRYLSTAVAVVLLLALAGVAAALSMGNVDGVWEYIEDTPETSSTDWWDGGARCSRWATANSTTGNPTSWSNYDPTYQGAPIQADENQIRYGTTASFSPCTNTPIADQSGLGFDGREGIGIVLPTTFGGEPFWLGRFTHYNNPITTFSDYRQNALEWADIGFNVGGITCGNGQSPNEGSTISFTYRVYFQETPNSGTNVQSNPYYNGGFCASDNECFDDTCYYCKFTNGTDSLCPFQGSGINSNGCADRTRIEFAPGTYTFTCDDANEPAESQGIWTIALLGFQDNATNRSCASQTYDPDALQNSYLTREGIANNACLWAVVTAWQPTSVELTSFSAKLSKDRPEVTLVWETATETENVGFNLYRSETADAPGARVNAELISSKVAPGSPFGAVYTYNDSNANLKSRAVYYWLEDLDIRGNTELHGPLMVRRPMAKVRDSGPEVSASPDQLSPLPAEGQTE